MLGATVNPSDHLISRHDRSVIMEVSTPLMFEFEQCRVHKGNPSNYVCRTDTSCYPKDAVAMTTASCKLSIGQLTEAYYYPAAALPQLRCPDSEPVKG